MRVLWWGKSGKQERDPVPVLVPVDGEQENIETLDAIQIAMTEARVNPAPDSPAIRLLQRQEKLIETQTREANAHISQLGRERWRDIIISLIGLCILGTGGLFVWDAAQARGVAIEPFRVPPEMEARGLDGVVVATQVMDQLLAMQAATESIRAPSTYANNWGDDIAVEIPNTGVTIGDLRSSLRAWFGQQVRLTGEVVRLPDGRVAVTVRVGSVSGERFTGAEGEFDRLVQQAAESVYRQTQAYRYSIWLRNNGRADEAAQIVDELASSANAEDRLWAINTVSARTEDPQAAIALIERGLRLDPEFTPLLYNGALRENGIGREGRALHYTTRMIAAESIARRQINPARIDQIMLTASSQHATLRRDMPLACEQSRQLIEVVTDAVSRLLAPLNAAFCYASARDIPAARQLLADVGLNDPERMRAHIAQLGPDNEVESAFAFALGDWNTVYDITGGVLVSMSQSDLPYNLLVDQSFLIRSNLALAAAHTGRIAEAREIVAGLPADCTTCVRVRGTVEALAGDAAAARRQFEIAMEQGSNLPTTYGEYAEALVILRDWRDAVAQARRAARMAPRWADPHMAWGDALMGLGNHSGAVGRYRTAERLAPNWGALKLALGRAYAALGDAARAREAWTQAAALPLSPADAAAVQGLLAQP